MKDKLDFEFLKLTNIIYYVKALKLLTSGSMKESVRFAKIIFMIEKSILNKSFLLYTVCSLGAIMKRREEL